MQPIRSFEICLDVVEPAPVAAFWTEFLGYTTADALDDRWVHLQPPTGLPVLNLQRVPEAKTIKNRLHFDVYVDDPQDWIERATALGATEVRLHDAPEDWFMVMLDPGGNEFCICLERDPADIPG
jgi:hypothetical protein